MEILQGPTFENTLRHDFGRLRNISESDASTILKWRTSPRARFIHKGAETLDEQISWMRRRPRNELNFMIECSCGRVVGMISLVNINQKLGSGESARFFVDQRYSQMGFAVLGMHMLYRVAFLALDLKLVVGFVAVANKNMVRWHENFGMVTVGTAESTQDIRGLGRELVEMHLSKDRYIEFTLPKMEKTLTVFFPRFPSEQCPCS